MSRIFLFFILITINIFCYQSIETVEDGGIYYTKGQELGWSENVHANSAFATNSYVYSSINGDRIPVGTMVKLDYKNGINDGVLGRCFLILDGNYKGEWVHATVKELTATKEEAIRLQNEVDELIKREKIREYELAERREQSSKNSMFLFITFIISIVIIGVISLKEKLKDIF